MKKRLQKPPRLAEILGHYFKRSGLNRKIEEQKILEAWERAVGEPIAARTQPTGVKNRVLQVKVTNSVWMQQLHFMKGLILQNLREQIGEHFLQDLRFSIGEVEPSVGKRKKEPEGNPRGQSPGLTEAEKEHIEKVLSGIMDPEMRELLSRVFSKGAVAGKDRRIK
jgi:predicted nucleic acid-binding Zn ribbon protein